ncbi:MAG: hypothetical protein NZM35_12185 [Chitinophagales bacterium]|nr:hypothetical protein [Chitinophagales bacterium]MDW8420174.1 hypothetical protein [Chitinophagales bacterium]
MPVVLTSIVATEIAGFLIHKYLLHGVLWPIHRAYHKRYGNGLKFLPAATWIYIMLATALIVSGAWLQTGWLNYAGIGIALYAAISLLVDAAIKFKINIPYFANNLYIRALRKARQLHERIGRKDAPVHYGLLWVNTKHFKDVDIPAKWKGENILF